MKRPDKIFGHRLWMTPVASYIGIGALVYGAYVLIAGSASLVWVLPAMLCTFLMLMGVTVGMHRLFCHASFKTSQFWHGVLAFFGTLAIYGSTVQWPAMHASHHKFADTPNDPHYTGWRYLFWKKNNRTAFNKRVLRRLYRNPLHRFLHRWYVLVVASVVLLLTMISVNALVFLYLIPLGWLHFVGSLHQVLAHGPEGPRDQGALEVVLFTGGEWLHGHHHARPKDPRFGTGDLGWQFIRAIQRHPVAPGQSGT